MIIYCALVLYSVAPSLVLGAKNTQRKCNQVLSGQKTKTNSSLGSPKGYPLSKYFAALAREGYHIGQSDERLDRRGLLVPNGGLCATTCGANVLKSLYTAKYKKIPQTAVDFMIHRLVEDAWKSHASDARYGLSLEMLGPAMKRLSSELGIGIEFSVINQRDVGKFSLSDILPAHNELIIASVSAGTDPITRMDTAHAIVILEVRPNQVLLVDPNFHGILKWRELDFVSHPLGAQFQPTLRIPHDTGTRDGRHGEIYSLLKIQLTAFGSKNEGVLKSASGSPTSRDAIIQSALRLMGKQAKIVFQDGRSGKFFLHRPGFRKTDGSLAGSLAIEVSANSRSGMTSWVNISEIRFLGEE